MKIKYIFPVEEESKLNLVKKNEVRIFPGNDKKMKRLGKPLIGTRCFLDRSLQRVR